MFERCKVCEWRMRNKCGACKQWSLVNERGVAYNPKKRRGRFALRCLHCGRHNRVDNAVAEAVIPPEVLGAVKRKWEWDHPRV